MPTSESHVLHQILSSTYEIPHASLLQLAELKDREGLTFRDHVKESSSVALILMPHGSILPVVSGPAWG